MRRPALYSSARHASRQRVEDSAAVAATENAIPTPSRVRRLLQRKVPASLLAALLLPVMLVAMMALFRPQQAAVTQEEINAAVMQTLEKTILPSPAVKAYEAVRPAVVRVTSYSRHGKILVEDGVGTGVMIIDKGIILTNLHVVSGAERLQLTFADGSESDAYIAGTRPEQDLAVLQAYSVPDGIKAATMRSSSKLVPGEHVFAVGFPFGIGPSVSAGVVSGLKREYLSPEGKRILSDLIQFDTAANPGNSGGPLVTADGKVVGIVTGILNPTSQRVFIGIGFAVPIESAASAAGMPPF